MEHHLVGVSRNIQRVKELIRNIAGAEVNTLICGETGVGKELVAQGLFFNSSRNEKPFIKVNCAALPDTLLESEMFGHEQGAFTGAVRKKRGKFEQADLGVLFLDEIGDMTLPLQSKLLHALQDGNFSPLGSEKNVHTNAWVISATNHKLESDMQDGSFRNDLYYRLGVMKIEVSPLRERPEDIPHLIKYFAHQFTVEFNGRPLKYPDNRIIEKLCAYHWPGNVRELQNILKRYMIVDREDQYIEEYLSGDLPTTMQPSGNSSASGQGIVSPDLMAECGINLDSMTSFPLKEISQKACDRVETKLIGYALEQTGWNKSRAARMLDISYKALLYKIQGLNIRPASLPN